MTKEQLIEAIINDKYKNVVKIAEDKFGKDNIDYGLPYDYDININTIQSLQNYYARLSSADRYTDPTVLHMIIYFPKKTVVCNETGQSHDIEEIYCNVGLTRDNKFNITTARAKYTTAEVNSQYTHSHVSGISTPSSIWKSTCLGNDNTPLNVLRHKSSKDDLDWIQIFNEIDRFYEVESLRGVPYNRIDNISMARDRISFGTSFAGSYKRLTYLDEEFNEFVDFTMEKLRKNTQNISNIDGEFKLNQPLYDFKITLTNLIVEYLQKFSGKELKQENNKFKKILEKNIKTPSGEYTYASSRIISLDDVYLFDFKGKRIYRKVIPSEHVELILMPNLIFQVYVYLKLLIMLNYEKFRDTTERVNIVL